MSVRDIINTEVISRVMENATLKWIYVRWLFKCYCMCRLGEGLIFYLLACLIEIRNSPSEIELLLWMINTVSHVRSGEIL